MFYPTPGGGGREADPLPSDGQEAAFIVVTQDPGNALPPGHGAGKGVRTVPQVLHVGDITVSDQMRPPDWRPWENVRVPEGSERDPREGSGAPHQRETSGSRTEPLLGHNGKMTASRTLPHPIGKNFRRDICRAGDIGLILILGFCLEAGRGGFLRETGSARGPGCGASSLPPGPRYLAAPAGVEVPVVGGRLRRRGSGKI